MMMRHFRTAVAMIVLAAWLLPGPAASQLEDAAAALSRGDYATGLRIVRPLAEQGDARAQYNLAVSYEQGWGVSQDLAEAARWYRRAAEQGYSLAQHNLGEFYRAGRGVARD